MKFQLSSEEERSSLLSYDKSIPNPNRLRLNSDPPIPLWRKSLFIFGGLGKNSATYVLNAYITIFLLEIAQLQPIVVSVILLLSKCMSACTDPVTGYYVSNGDSERWGRARPWMIVSAPLGALAYTCLWCAVPFPAWGSAVYYTIMYWIWSSSCTAFYVSFASSIIALTNSQSQRDEITAYRMTGEGIGAVLGPAIMAIFIFVGGRLSWTNSSIYLTAGGCIGGLFLICGILSVVCVNERHRLPAHTHGNSFYQYYRSLFTYKPFTILIFVFIFASVGYTVPSGILLLYFKYVWNLSSIGPLLIVILFLTSAISIPIWHNVLLPFIGSKPGTFCAATIPMMGLFISLLFLESNIYVAVIVSILFGFLLGCAIYIPQSVIPDAVAAYSLTHSYGSEAGFYALATFMDLLSVAVCNAISTAILQVAGYDNKLPSEEQPSSVSLSLRLIMGAFPVMCLLISVILMCEYPIKESHRKKMDQLIKRSLTTNTQKLQQQSNTPESNTSNNNTNTYSSMSSSS